MHVICGYVCGLQNHTRKKDQINPINPQEGSTEAFSDVSSKYSLVTQHAPLSGTLLITATKPNDLKESKHVSQSLGTTGTWLPMC